ncbi:MULTISPECIES: hypothetical protein [Bacillus]|uniref:hypothetical protein n=1 Tax=Bacillus TaxID=1386 RepID=UPI000D02508A|nr:MULTISPECIES: hypothetical protein [Bacillus]MBI1628851.1 hypothetical protein [Bacillus safensis]MBR0581266.1 hypothetical protein [Bacillus altitudinis A23-8]MDC7795040.1 hypothetical protein [Bacillus altitudinis]PRS24242.1 hypothetical protein C6X94_03650 [Bacillus safensis]
MADIKVSLTQFLDFTMKGNSSSKTKQVRKIKYEEYSPGSDYWRQLRNEIRKIHENDLPIELLYNLIDRIVEKRKDNYRKSISQYINFIKSNQVEWFSVGDSSWTFEDKLLVRSQPELGLSVNGEPLLLKIYYKGKNNRVDKRKVQTTLHLMGLSNKNFEPPVGAKPAILNLHNNKLYKLENVDRDLELSLNSEAMQFYYLYNSI